MQTELIEELRLIQQWLSLDHLEIANRGDLAPQLRKHIPSKRRNRIDTTPHPSTNMLGPPQKRGARSEM